MHKKAFIKSCIVALSVALCFIAALSSASAEGLTKISEGVYSYVGLSDSSPQNSYAANAGIVIGDDGILVVDTLISAKAAGKFVADIRKVSDKPIKYVVNTHGHLDHAFGNAVFREMGALIISQADSAEYLMQHGEATIKGAAGYGLSEQDMEGTVIAAPRISFTDKMSIDLGGRTVELMYLGPSHTAGSIAVFVPGASTVFAGDILFTDFHPFLGEGDIKGWLNALDALAKIGADKIIPGHGPVSSSRDISAMKEYLTIFDAKATELAAKSDDAEQITAELLKVLPTRAGGAFLITSNVHMKYMRKK